MTKFKNEHVQTFNNGEIQVVLSDIGVDQMPDRIRLQFESIGHHSIVANLVHMSVQDLAALAEFIKEVLDF